MAMQTTMVVKNNDRHDCSRSHGFQDDDRFFPRLLSRESYNSSRQGGEEASFRVLYYGGTAGSVPFLWESRPGTPKQTFNDDAVPPLTPPPPFRIGTSTGSSRKKRRSAGLFYSVFLKLPSKKINTTSPPALVGGAWEAGVNSPSTSTLCFGDGSESPRRGTCRRRCSSPMKGVKKMVQSMLGSRRTSKYVDIFNQI